MVIITRFDLNDEVWYWSASGTFKKSTVKTMQINVVEPSSFIQLVSAAFVFFSSFFKDKKPPELPNNKTEIIYKLTNGKIIEESRLFLDEETAVNSIIIFTNAGE